MTDYDLADLSKKLLENQPFIKPCLDSFNSLLANLPNLQSKLELPLESDPLQWFNEKLGEIDRRAKNEKRSKKVENKKEDFDLDEYLAKFNL